ncbi:D-serine dehydratase [Seminavis robusta]|uniref:D-serine dehydratase n=1 Tax=Seminavis robusta TaxID=568900 RepID=A0A9N8E2T1_9STRA|nr:D-serine dehydratase [Seminavis robusta]|eukprot:Sro598_g172940.1 D-serine dehydratase (515) ;mRNA; f:4072-5715
MDKEGDRERLLLESNARPSLMRLLSINHKSAQKGSDGTTTTTTGTLKSTSANDDDAPFSLEDLPTPAFVINRHAFAGNCQRVLDFCTYTTSSTSTSSGATSTAYKLRPHIKTHKTLEGIHLQAHGTGKSSSHAVNGFVASTIPEVKLLVNYYTTNSTENAGSILYGIPISETKLPPLFVLQQRLDDWTTRQQNKANKDHHIPIHILIDHPQQVQMVEQFLAKQEQQSTPAATFSVFCKLDTGYHRAGTTCDKQGIQLVTAILQSKALRLVGFYSHCGHAYDVEDQSKLQEIANTDMNTIQQFLMHLEQHWNNNNNNNNINPQQVFDKCIISVGSTPSLFHHPTNHNNSNEWPAFQQRHTTLQFEIHPGNYTLYDRQQLHTSACADPQHIAGRVLSRVIGHYDDDHRPQTVLLDAGATALTKETTPQGGMAAIASVENVDVYRMSQEASMARRHNNSSNKSLLEELPLGSMVTLLPNHSCLAAACFDTYYVIDDPSCRFLPETAIVEEWIPVKGW